MAEAPRPPIRIAQKGKRSVVDLYLTEHDVARLTTMLNRGEIVDSVAGPAVVSKGRDG